MAGPLPFLTSPLEARWTALGARPASSAEGWRVPEVFTSVAAEAEAARRAVALGDQTPRGKLLVQGDEALALAQRALGVAPEAVGRMVQGDGVEASRLRRELLFVGAEPAVRARALAALQQAVAGAAGLVTVTDVTHGRFELRLVGPAAAELMSRVCSLDFDERAFPSASAKETSVARTRQLVVRSDLGDLPAFRLIGGRALGAYVWDTLMQAGRGLGIAPIGSKALGDLAE